MRALTILLAETSSERTKFMGKAKRLRRERSASKQARRWEAAHRYLALVDLDEHRRFYARTTKYLLKPNDWDLDLRSHSQEDHPNLQVMLLEFNRQRRGRMLNLGNPDVTVERSVITALRRGGKRRLIAKHF